MKTKEEYLMALAKAHEDSEAYGEIVSLIDKHFATIEHMKKTSLFDIFEYEERIAKNTIEPMRMLYYDNERLKKEVNNLRKQLGKIEKYREVSNVQEI